MIKIGICDDEPVISRALMKMMKECLKEWDVDTQILEFDSGEKVLKVAKDLDVLFLDIRMPDMDGIEVGHKIKNMNAECKIIMATCELKRFKEVFKFSAFDYITKPFNKIEVGLVLRRVIGELQNMKTLEVYKDRVMYEVYLKDIKYMSAIDSSTEIMLKSGVFRKETSLKEFEKILDKKYFFRINRKCIINFRWVQDYEQDVVFIDGLRFKISVRRRKEFLMSYLSYVADFK